MNKADHSLLAITLKFIIITSLDSIKLRKSTFRGALNRIGANIFLDIIPEIGEESHTIIKFDIHSLVINESPPSINDLLITLLSIFAENSFDLVVVEDVYSVNIILIKLKFMLLVYELDLVGNVMGANFLGLIEVNLLKLWVNVEVPNSENRFSDAVNWLICFN